MDRQYTKEELTQLHTTLYEILEEIDRVCSENGIQYFLIGGSALGVHFWEGIIPWDDDIDVGMTRDNYNRFLHIAPSKLKSAFFLQCQKSEPHHPYFFAKVRKNGTSFVEEDFQGLDIHQGIFVDVFPFDRRVPLRIAESLQYKLLHFFAETLTSKEAWQFARLGHSPMRKPVKRSLAATLLARMLCACLSKKCLYAIVTGLQTMFNGIKSTEIKNTICKTEFLTRDDAENAERHTFGPLQVLAPRHLVTYLTNHYKVIQKDYPEELRVTHRPVKLSF